MYNVLQSLPNESELQKTIVFCKSGKNEVDNSFSHENC